MVRKHQILFCLIIVVMLLLIYFFESGFLPVGLIGDTAESQYAADVLSVVITLFGIYFALRMFVLPPAVKNFRSDVLAAYRKWDGLRLLTLAIVIWTDTLVYFSSINSNSSHYALLITLFASVFCWPNNGEIDALEEKYNNKETTE